MRDIFRDKTKVLEIANLGWVPVNDGDWSTITLSLTGSLDESFEGTAHHLVNSYRRVAESFASQRSAAILEQIWKSTTNARQTFTDRS
jgi:hypothetical protein